jgi:hypothetical protein
LAEGDKVKTAQATWGPATDDCVLTDLDLDGTVIE